MAGDLAADAPELATLLDGCAECRAQWHGMRRLVERMAATRDEMRADLAAAERAELPGGSERVRAVMHDVLREAGARPELAASPTPSVSRARWWLLAAAAAVLAFVLGRLYFAPPPQHDPRDIVLGKIEGLTLEAPAGDVVAFDRFAWSYTRALDPGEHFEIAVQGWDEAKDTWRTLTPARTRPRAGASTWSPSVELAGAWPGRIRWSVGLARGDDPPERWSDWVEASRSR
jgi:hypothetical protein